MHVEPHHPADELAPLIRAEARANVSRRLFAVRLALLGRRPEDIAPRFASPRGRSAPRRGRPDPAGRRPPGRADPGRRGLHPPG